MKRGTTVALGLAGGYLLGRFKKARFLLMTAAAVAASRRAGGGALQRGAETLKSSPEVGKLAEQGREAAMAVLGRRMEGLTGTLHAAAERVRGPGAEAREGEEQAEAEEEPPEAEAEPPEAEEEEEEEAEEKRPEAEEGREGERPREGEEQPERAKEEPGGGPSGQQAPQRAPRPGTRRPGAERTQRQDRRADPTGRRTGPSRIRR